MMQHTCSYYEGPDAHAVNIISKTSTYQHLSQRRVNNNHRNTRRFRWIVVR